jgi:hypothetical protein
MKKLISIIFILVSLTIFGQKKDIKPTDGFSVTGEVKKELNFTMSDVEKLQPKTISDVTITNHLGEARGTANNLSGILLRDLLNDIEFNTDNPKLLSEFYLTFVASDNYKVVYSWNEIFNSPTGENLFLITSKDGKQLAEMDERILVITPTDYKTGRRNIKGLQKIIVGRAD